LSNIPQDDKQQLLEQLSKFIEEQARMRFHQKIQHQHHQKQHQPPPQEITGPGFSFMLPQLTKDEFNRDNDQPIQFAVEPFDSRYYEINDEDAGDDFSENLNSNVNEELPAANVPPPMHPPPADKIFHRNQLKQKQQQQQQQPEVMQKPMQVEFDNTMSLYVVALIAGISCAFSTGVSLLRFCFSSDVNSFEFLCS
jgi:hypothetical protein